LRHHQAGQVAQAQTLYRQILSLQSEHAGALHYLGVIAYQSANLDTALDLIRRAIALRPGYVEAHSNLGNVLKDKGQLDEAIAAYRQAIAINPNLPETHNNLGVVLKNKEQLDQAIAAFQLAIVLRPNYPEAYNNLGNALRDNDQLDQAIAAYRQALALRSDYAEAYSNLGNALTAGGQPVPSIAAYRQAIALEPKLIKAHSNLLLALHYLPDYDVRNIAEEHFRWNRQHAEPMRPFIPKHTNDRDPDRRVRIGYVSPDMRSHSVAYFLESLLAYHDPTSVEVFCYANVTRPDQVTVRFQRLPVRWRNIVGLNDAQAAQTVREDGVDILVDLAGHAGDGRMVLFARKPAPIAVTYLGYPDTTGLTTIDYRLTDAHADPPGLTESLHSEKLYRLPATFLCYRPSNAAPAVAPLPALGGGGITFGSFNALTKVNGPLVALWARILDRVPNSRLILKRPALQSAHARRNILQYFSDCDIGPDRLELIGSSQTKGEHLQMYHRIDIALDTFPYHGTTTTCEAIWMGVPVVSLAGNAHVSRVGASILSNIGLSELIADSGETYVRMAIELAQDLPRLQKLRATLRQRMAGSPLMNAPLFARNVESAYRQMWRAWCTGNTAGGFAD